ncbi:MAG: hypothetical protein RIC16_10265 [Rhodospirillales bacterium]
MNESQHGKIKRGVAGPPEDPVNLMQQVFDHASEFMGPAPDILLSWLMRLAPEVDQPSAARWVLDSYARPAAERANAESRKLIELLEQAAEGEMPRGARRRGGRRARIN